MKEATGGALLMGLAAGIILIFVIMAAFFISYGRTFRIKNEILNAIEQKEGMSLDDLKDFVAGKATRYSGRDIRACYNPIKHGEELKGFTMNIVVYMAMNRNILGSVFNVEIPVMGETRIIEKGYYFDHLSELEIDECPVDNDTDAYTKVLDI